MFRPFVLCVFALAACDGAGPATDTSLYEAVCTEPVTVGCQTEWPDHLPLHDAVAAGGITATIDGNDWITDLDATAGSFIDSPDNPWLYVRFTDEGAQKVDITDVEALDSMEWHMALHRFRVRLNGGSSGPSCVAAAAYPDIAYADLTVEDEATGDFEVDGFFDDTCTFQAQAEDPLAPPGIPVVAMNDWWTYPDCVATTGVPFLIKLDTGRMLKAEVLRFYSLGQEECNLNGTMGGGSAEIQLKWAFVH